MANKGRMQKPKRKRERLSSAPQPKREGRPRTKQTGTLARWLDATPMTAQEVADKLKISVGFLYRLRCSSSTPGLQLANRIATLTDGLVPAASWQ